MLSRLKSLTQRLGLIKPTIIQAPMAGGITTPELVAAVSNNFGLGSYASGYVKTQDVLINIQKIKKLTSMPFSVNLFIHNQPTTNFQEIERYNLYLNKYRSRLNIPAQHSPPSELTPQDNNQEIIDIVIAEKVPVISFTFGILEKNLIQKLQKNNIVVIGTATSLEEAKMLEKSGVDAIVAQGYEAGGHRGGFFSSQQSSLKSTLTLVPQLSKNISLPIIAAGGIMSGDGIISALALGASGVQMGTAFLTTVESGATPLYKQQLLKAKDIPYDNTRITKAYSGKDARGLITEFMNEIENDLESIPPYPIPNTLTSPIRKEASKQNDVHLMSLWSGQAVSEITESLSAEQLMKSLFLQIKKTLSDFNELNQSIDIDESLKNKKI
jgi:nitronate monooxygenase